MGRLITIILLLAGLNLKAQTVDDIRWMAGDTIIINVMVFKTKIGAKLIQKRFDKAVINKDIYPHNDKTYKYFIELEENDENEFFYLIDKRKTFIKIYCLPKWVRESIKKGNNIKKRKKLLKFGIL